MAEPSTAVLQTATTGISVGALVLGLDVETIIGAVAGATIFVTQEKELGLPMRLLYLLVSVAFGYFIAPEITAKTIITSNALAGFLGGLFTVSGGQLLLRQLQNTDLKWLIRK